MRVELAKLFRRPRTWLTILLLNALPTLVAVLVSVTGVSAPPGQGPAFLSAVLANGSLFAVAALAIVLPLFLPVAVAVVAGDSIAGEAQAGTLRYLLVRPVGRTRLLVAKLVATLVFVLVAVLSVAVVGFGVGRLLLGSQPISQAIVSSSEDATRNANAPRLAVSGESLSVDSSTAIAATPSIENAM